MVGKQTPLYPDACERLGGSDLQREVQWISLDTFIHDVLPQSYVAKFPQIDVVVAQLKNDSAFEDDSSWSGFLPGALDSVRLAKIVIDISEAAAEVAIDHVAANRAPQHLDYVHNGSKPFNLGHINHTSRSDGFFALKNRARAAPEDISWWDIAVVGALTDAIDDVGIPSDHQRLQSH